MFALSLILEELVGLSASVHIYEMVTRLCGLWVEDFGGWQLSAS